MRITAVDRLREGVSGEVVLPGDRAYDTLRNTFVHSGSPAVVVRCRNPADVGTAVRYARDHALPVSVRSGGHSGAGFGTNQDGLVVDLSPIDQVRLLDRDRGLVRLGTGATWAAVAGVLGPHRLAISSGDTTSVGVGGLMLGGGIGWLVRKFGLALDSLVAAEVVTADGEVVRASAGQHADLFWALRGGGGNLGVVTTFDAVANPVPGVFFGKAAYPRAEAGRVLKGWRDHLRTAPDELTAFAYLFPAFDDEPMPVYVTACYAGDDPAAAWAAIDPLLRLGTLLEHDIRPMPYAGVLEEPGELPAGLVPTVRNRFVDVVSDRLVDSLVAHAGALAPLFVELRSLGGAVARVPPDATAFAHRGGEALVMTVLLDTGDAAAAEFEAMWGELGPLTAGAAYGNLLSTADEPDVAAVYPPGTYARLAAVKASYDPENVFRHNHNVRPAAADGSRPDRGPGQGAQSSGGTAPGAAARLSRTAEGSR